MDPWKVHLFISQKQPPKRTKVEKPKLEMVDFEDRKDYDCPINLDCIFSDGPLKTWLEEIEETLLDGDTESASQIHDLTGNEPEQVRALEQLC